MAFDVSVKSDYGGTFLQVQGVLDEYAVLPTNIHGPEITIDLNEMTYINSVGIRIWIRWLQETSRKGKVILKNCPVIFVKNLASIRGMMDKNTKVESFYVPYYDETIKQRKNMLFKLQKEFFEDGRVKLPTVKDSAGNLLEPDVILENYFAFLTL